MRPVRRAVIDVGTNSCKLLVAEVSATAVEPVLEESRQTRLGQGFYQTHRLQAAAIARTAQAVAELAGNARERQAQSIRVIGTSAAREATNAEELSAAVREASGLPLQIISGEQEAEWAFQGVADAQSFTGEALLLLDVGGGSTEFVLGRGAHKHFSQSVPLGTVRLMEQFPHSDPPQPAELARCRGWVRQFLVDQVRPMLAPALKRESAAQAAGDCARSVQLVGTGGTASILGCMEAQLEHFDRARLEAASLSLDRLRWHMEHVWALRLEQRKQIRGLPKNRADVILYGVVIYEAVMSEFGLTSLRISTRGLRFAAVRVA